MPSSRPNGIDGELKAISSRMDALQGRIERVEKSVDSLRSELYARIDNALLKVDQMNEMLGFERRMTILEAEIKELEKRR
jgi:predicted  nucleic acid-binding Zn-ribbon protein